MEYHRSVWQSEISQQTKLEMYKNILTEYGNEKIIEGIFRKEERSLLCQLLCGNLKLGIEIGR